MGRFWIAYPRRFYPDPEYAFIAAGKGMLPFVGGFIV